MKNQLLFIIIIASVILGCKQGENVNAQTQTIDLIKPGIKEAIDLRIDKGINQSIAIGVIDSTGVDFYSNGLTAVNGQKPDTFTAYEIGSITKVFTGLLLAEAVITKDINLTDSIGKFLPTTLKLNDTISSLRLEQLATHSAGLARQSYNLRSKGYVATNPYAHYDENLLLDELKNHQLRFKPGDQSQYSNLSMSLLGYLMSKPEGKDYFTSLSENVLEPLAMQQTTATFTGNNNTRGYTFKVPVDSWNFDVLAGAGVLKSNINDMLLFLSAQMGLTKTSLKQAIKISQQIHYSIDDEKAIGLGWGIYSLESGDTLYRHNGGTAGYRSFVGFLKKAKVGVMVLTNSSHVGVDDLGLHQLADSFDLNTDFKPSIANSVSTILEQNEHIKFDELRLNIRHDTVNSKWGELNFLGYTYLKKKEFDKAIKVFQLNNEIHPNSADGYDSLAEAYYSKGQFDESIQNYEKALAIDADYENAKRMIATIKTEQKSRSNQ